MCSGAILSKVVALGTVLSGVALPSSLRTSRSVVSHFFQLLFHCPVYHRLRPHDLLASPLSLAFEAYPVSGHCPLMSARSAEGGVHGCDVQWVPQDLPAERRHRSETSNPWVLPCTVPLPQFGDQR